MTGTASLDGLALDVGFTLGLDMAFDRAVERAADEGFAFVEVLLDGPYACDRIADRIDAMRATLAEAGVGVVVHLPFAVDPSHALLAKMDEVVMAVFLREHADRVAHLHLVDTRGGNDEHLPVGMGRVDFETALVGLAERDWSGTATLEIGTEDYDTIALGLRHTETLLS